MMAMMDGITMDDIPRLVGSGALLALAAVAVCWAIPVLGCL